MHQLAGSARKLTFLAFVFWAAVIAFKPIIHLDFWWQLAEGIQILHGKWPGQPLHAFAFPAAPYPHEYGLFEIFIAALWLAGGDFLVWLTWGIVATAALWIFLRAALPARSANDFSVIFVFFIFLSLFALTRHRPDTASLLFLVLMGALLLRQDQQPAPPLKFWALLSLLLFLWSNIHSSYVVGSLMILSWTLNRALLSRPVTSVFRPLLPALALSLLVPILHPDGWHNLLRPFLNAQNPAAKLATWEMWPPDFFQIFLSACLFLLAILFIYGHKALHRHFWLLFCLCLFFGMFLLSRRYALLLCGAAMVTALLPSGKGSDLFPFRFSPAPALAAQLSSAVLIVLILLGHLKLRRDASPFYVKKGHCAPGALDWLARQKETPLFFCSEWHPASLAQTYGTRLRPFQDSGLNRFDPPSTYFYHALLTNPQLFQESLNRLQVDAWVINPSNVQWLVFLRDHPLWKLAYADEEGLVFMKNPAVPTGLPSSWEEHLTRIMQKASGDKNRAWMLATAQPGSNEKARLWNSGPGSGDFIEQLNHRIDSLRP